ncbi:MAG TPA: alpha/beta hydrolase [Bacteroidetes bacterium]|nr:alpha/beta hydrolase [Bacteroidota bacterium]
MSSYIKKPSLFKVLFETRALFELGVYYSSFPFLKNVPRGEGQPVLVLPGLLASDFSTGPLRKFLNAKGYHAYPWQLGRNRGQVEYIEKLEDKIKGLNIRHGKKVNLIGWSLGGIFARLMANKMPGHIRQVITLGSPFMGIHGESNADFAYEMASGQKRGDVDPQVLAMIEKVPDMPFTSIYSKGDGIVCWQHCIEPTKRDNIQNIEVIGSHLGLGHNASALLVIADRLAQEEGYWQPFVFERGIKGLVYPQYWKGASAVLV